MRASALSLLLLPLALTACGHVQLSSSELNTVSRPAFVARLELDAGPRSTVFQDLSSQASRLQGLSAAEGDRRMAAKLAQGATPFEVAERLRIGVVNRLPREAPWTHTVPAAEVAAVLQSLLVEDQPQQRPDVRQLERIGADTLIELVIERYGLMGSGGVPTVYVSGRARMTRLHSGATYYHRTFSYRLRSSEALAIDPLAIGQEPLRFREALSSVIEQAAAQIAEDLQPSGRSASALGRRPDRPSLDDSPDSVHREAGSDPAQVDLPEGELPPP